MKRRQFTRIAGLAAGSLAFGPPALVRMLAQAGDEHALAAIEKLRGESPARAEIRSDRGGPRLYLNGNEVYPFLGSCTSLFPTIKNYEAAGIPFIHPIIGLIPGWTGPGTYNWNYIDVFLGKLLSLFPDAFFLPRVHLNTPDWWLDAHPDEIITYGLATPSDRYDLIRTKHLSISECGVYFGFTPELREASFASEQWRIDTGGALRNFLGHMEHSPLASRIIGYHPTWGMTAEWNYFGEDFIPDYSEPMKKGAGPIPSAEERMHSTFGLLRNPEHEAHVISFYERFYGQIAETVIRMAAVVKEATSRRVLCGVFYAYVTEIPRIQEGGYQGAEQVLQSPDIDYIASPYCYQPGNAVDDRGRRVTMVDGAGNKFGHPRGVAGDGGFRLPVESLRRRGKMFISEMDPSTYRDSSAYDVTGGLGGLGSDTVEGSIRILRRDIGNAFANGVGGWMLDFGPLNNAPDGWYSGEKIINEIRQLAALGSKRPALDISSEAEICNLPDLGSFNATQHWKAGYPWTNYGIKSTDYIDHWFLDTQARSLHRIGAPMDELYRFDFTAEDARRYKLVIIPNAYLLEAEEADRIRNALRDSGATVIWIYAAGFITRKKLDLEQMQRLTGFQFRVLDSPGTMLVDSAIPVGGKIHRQSFGVNENHFPRFVVGGGDVFGEWADHKGPAFALREHEGHTSVYVGSGPLPVEILRILAQKAGVRLWSDKPDIISATRGAAMIVATKKGRRTLSLPRPMTSTGSGDTKREHQLEMEYGDVELFVAG